MPETSLVQALVAGARPWEMEMIDRSVVKEGMEDALERIPDEERKRTERALFVRDLERIKARAAQLAARDCNQVLPSACGVRRARCCCRYSPSGNNARREVLDVHLDIDAVAEPGEECGVNSRVSRELHGVADRRVGFRSCDHAKPGAELPGEVIPVPQRKAVARHERHSAPQARPMSCS